MSNRLGGKQGTAYLGTNANQPPNVTFHDHNPNQFNTQNFSLGDFWLNTTSEDLWVLTSLARVTAGPGQVATWVKIESSGIPNLDRLTGNNNEPVTPDVNSNINIVGDGVGITITGIPSSNTLVASLVGGGIAAESFHTDNGGIATPVAGVLNIITNVASNRAGSTIFFSGNGDTVLLNTTDLNDNVIIGQSSGNAGITGGDNTVLGEDSAFSLTAGSSNTIIGQGAGIAITSGSNNILVGAGAGDSLTTSNSSNTLIGHDGVAGSTNLVVIARGSGGAPFLHNFPGSNTTTTNGGNVFLGANAGNFTLNGGAGNASNNGIGSGCLEGLTTGARNDGMGSFTLSKLTTGSDNVAIGMGAGFNSGANTGLVSGVQNVIIGYTAGSAYTAAESNNIVIGSAGVIAENNTIRLGTTGTGAGQQSTCFVAGIHGINPATADGIPVFIGSAGQLGTVGNGGSSFIGSLTGDGSVVVSPLLGNINIVGDGSTAAVTANPSTHTLTISAIGSGGGSLNDLVGDDSINVVPLAGIINVVANNSVQGCGATVEFTGAVANTLTLNVTDTTHNTIVGGGSGNGSITGTANTVFGSESATDLSSGNGNTIIGEGAGAGITSGSENVLIGFDAGNTYTSTESNNILLNSLGVIADANTLRIGHSTGTGSGQLNKAFIHGIDGITPTTGDGIPVFIGSNGQLGTVGSGAGSLVSTLTGNNTGVQVDPSFGNIFIQGDGTTATVVGDAGTNTLTISMIGGGGGTLTVLAGDTGSAAPSAGTINIIAGNSTLNAGSSVKFAGSGSTITFDVTDSSSNTIVGQGAGKAGITGINNTILGKTCGAALTTGSGNIFMGAQAGSLVTTGSGNVLFGDALLNTILQGTTTSNGFYAFGGTAGSLFFHNFGDSTSNSTFIGYGSGSSFNSGQQETNRNNTGCGVNSLQDVTIGADNTAVGFGAGDDITIGSSNVLIGLGAGSVYTNENANICIGTAAEGVSGDTAVLRIGEPNALNKAFIGGIRGVTTDVSNAIPVVIDSNGQLGTAGGGSVITTLTANTGGAVSATGGNINIRGDGTSITIAGSPGTSTLTVSAVGGSAGPSFLAHVNTTYLGANNNIFTIAYDTTVYNIGGAFNLGTSTFTAPTTGIYNFAGGVGFGNNASSSIGAVTFMLKTTNKTFLLNYGNFNTMAANNNNGFACVITAGNSAYTNMTAGDTAILQVYVFAPTGSTSCKVSGSSGQTQQGISGLFNYFSGSLV